MIKVENLSVTNLDGALRGMRNPLESWDKSDSEWKDGKYIVGENDRGLALKLIRAGSDHSKFMRQIFVSMDITAPMTWWWDYDTYKVGTTKNSTSRMHKLGTRILDFSDFSIDNEERKEVITPFRQMVLDDINDRIKEFQKLKQEGKIKEAMHLWRDIILDLPQSYNFKATWTGSYQNMRNIYHARRNHKQREFKDFCRYIEEEFPYPEFITSTRDEDPKLSMRFK